MTSDASAVEHQTEIGSDSAARLASWSCTCGASEVITFARPLGEPVALRLAGIGASQHKQDAATAAARDDRMGPDDVPAELLDLACDRMFGTPPEAGDDRRGMAEALAAVLPRYEALVRAEVAAEIEAYAEATARQQAAIPVFCSGLRKGAEIARGEA